MQSLVDYEKDFGLYSMCNGKLLKVLSREVIIRFKYLNYSAL